MPIIECGFPSDDAGDAADKLVSIGPTLFVDIGYDGAFDPNAGGVPAPQAQQIPALVDTGATESCIDDELAKELNLPLIDRQEIGGVGGKHIVNMYLAQIHTPSLAFTHYGRFAGVLLNEGGQSHRALIGRSFLQRFILIYDGMRGQVSLAI
jgi:predicted aspartyl protease